MAWQRFWRLIELGIDDPAALEHRIGRMSEVELVEFYWTYEEAAADLKGEEFTTFLAPPRTEDFVDDLAQWIVSQGLHHYEAIMAQPSTMPRELPSGAVPPPWTGVVSRTYRERYAAPVRFRDDPPPTRP